MHPSGGVLRDHSITHTKSFYILADFDDLASRVGDLRHRQLHRGVIQPFDDQLIAVIERHGADPHKDARWTDPGDRLVRQRQILPAKTAKFPSFHDSDSPILRYEYISTMVTSPTIQKLASY